MILKILNGVQRFLLFSILVFHTTFAIAKIEASLGIPPNTNINYPHALPETSESEILISRPQYLISYNKHRRLPNWVIWKVDSSNLGSSGRSNNFRIDSELENYLTQTDRRGFHAVSANDYANSCYDRGHQVPSGDRTNSRSDNTATFFMSNMAPQTPFLNRLIWERLESETRSRLHGNKRRAYIITGPLYLQNQGFIGQNNDIQVPSHFFKIVLLADINKGKIDPSASDEVISVIMPNSLDDGSNPYLDEAALCDSKTGRFNPKNKDWRQFQTSTEEIERVSGLNFQFQ